MNGIEKLTGRISEEAEAEISRILADAENKAQDIINEKKAEAESQSLDIIKKGKALAEQRVERLSSVANLEAKKQILATKQEMVSKAFDLALEKLINLLDDDKINLLSNLAVDASTNGNEEVVFSISDSEKYGNKVVEKANSTLASKGKNAELKYSQKTADIKGGIVVKQDDIEVNCSFETILRLMHDELATEISGVLFK